MLVETRALEMGHARALLTLAPQAAIALARQAAEHEWSVREVEHRVQQLSAGQVPARAQEGKPPRRAAGRHRHAGARTGETLGTRVNVLHGRGGKGRLVIHYSDLDALDGVLERLRGKAEWYTGTRDRDAIRAQCIGMTTLVTGAAGFIGAYVCRALLARGEAVVGLDNYNDYYDPQLKRDRGRGAVPGVRIAPLDLTDRDGLAALFDELAPARVIHLAAQAGVRYSLENRTPTSTATWPASSTCWNCAGTVACSTWCMRVRRRCTAIRRRRRSPKTSGSTSRVPCTRPPRPPTS